MIADKGRDRSQDKPARPGELGGGAEGWAIVAPAGAAGWDVGRWTYLIAMALLTVAGAALRLVWLDHPMRYDESWGFLNYILPGQISACLVYSAPNNHILHTLLQALAVAIGGYSPAVLRLPALLAGVALIPATGHLAMVAGGRRIAGLLAAAFVASSSILVEYSVNARGYTMFCLAAVLLAWCTVRICRDVRRWGPWVGWVLISAAGLLTIPIMIYPIVVLAIVLVLQAVLGPGVRRAVRMVLGRTAVTVAASGVLGFLLYAPVFYATGLVATEENSSARSSPLAVVSIGMYATVANPIIESKSLSAAAAGLPHAAREAWGEWTRDTSWPWPVLAAAGLAAAVVAGVRRRRAFYLLPLVAVVMLPGLALAQRVVPFGRVWMFVLPLVLAVACCGLAILASLPPAGWPRRLAVAAVLLAVAAINADAAWRVRPADGRVLGWSCLTDARAIVTDALTAADGRTGLAWDYEHPTWAPLAYYELLLSSQSYHFVPYLEDYCRRVLVVAPKIETLQEVLDHRPLLNQAYGPMVLWRQYPSADMYVAPRRR